ncbi:hypothetical protein [Chengkuizengella marina]|uniref:hypothetical protein n=1 Tax=Chengkuizengella marina TaxID=2507566 RepID=UPI002E2D7EB3|nr:hypothetical protein [Chengkuizengella marina]
MTKQKSNLDKNLENVIEDLDENPVNSFHAQQLHQKHEDRKHEDLKRDKGYKGDESNPQ